MRVRSILERIEAEAYPVLSDSKGMLVKYDDPDIIKLKDRRWDYWPPGSYEIITEVSE